MVVYSASVCIQLESCLCSIKRLPHVFKFIEPTLYWVVCETHFVKEGADISGSIERERASCRILGKERPVITELNGEYHLFAQKTVVSFGRRSF
jgi:hypothetical protein